MLNFNLNIESTDCSVRIADNLFPKIDIYLKEVSKNKKLVFVVDEYIAEKYFSEDLVTPKRSEKCFFSVPGKKNSKTFYSALKIFEFLDDRDIARDAIIVAIGGGVIGDLAGFVASCWYRGVDLIHVPTTLLSSVDSCIGGKTAINFRNTVNAVGSYHHPKAILIDTKVLLSLPDREIASGFAEIIKYCMLGADEIFKIIRDSNFDLSKSICKLIELSLIQKEKFVRNDIKESSNRLYLNFGHTIGHAIEFSTIFNGEETLRHGEGVALGMIAIFKIGVDLGLLSDRDMNILLDLLKKFKLPINFQASRLGLSRDILVERIVELCFKDKKRTKDVLRLVLLDGIGNPFIYTTNDRNLISKGVMQVIK